MAENENQDDPEQEADSCCPYRRKIVVGILKVMSEEECGIGDADLADIMRFDLAGLDGKPVLAFQFCPWCGKPRDPGGETRVTDVRRPEPDEGGPEFPTEDEV